MLERAMLWPLSFMRFSASPATQAFFNNVSLEKFFFRLLMGLYFADAILWYVSIQKIVTLHHTFFAL
jgi:hypothetical protein